MITALGSAPAVNISDGGSTTVTFSNIVDAAGAAVSLKRDDLLVVVRTGSDASDLSGAAPPTGWFTFVSLYSAGTKPVNFSIYGKFMTVTPDTSLTIAGSGDVTKAYTTTVFALRGVDTGSPIDVIQTATGTANSAPDPPSVTPSDPDNLLLIAGGAAGSIDVLTAPAGLTNLPYLFRNGVASDSNSVISGVGIRSSNGTTAFDSPAFGGGGAAATASWCAVSLSLKAGPPPYVVDFAASGMAVAAGSVSDIAITLSTALLDLNGGSYTLRTGDFVIVSATTSSTASRTLVGPAGWTKVTQIFANGTSGKANVVMWYKRMGAVPDTTFTLTGGTNNIQDGLSINWAVFRGVDPTTPLDVAITTASGTATAVPNPAAITPVTPGAAVAAFGGGANNTTGAVYTVTSGYYSAVLNAFRSNTSPDTNDSMAFFALHTNNWASGAVDPPVLAGGTAGAGDSWGAYTVALRPYIVNFTQTDIVWF